MVDSPYLGSGFIENFERRYPTYVLETLLADRTTGRNIIWADSEYEALGEGYMGDDEITVAKITGLNSGVIKPRIAKEHERQSQRTKSRAEVFTPSWLCNQMNNDIDEQWFHHRDIFNSEGDGTWEANPAPVRFPKTKGRGWHAYVESPRLEITCGEAPFICSRYDTVTGAVLPVTQRIGFLDRKLRIVTEKAKTRKDWINWALATLKTTYGFEYQGDNLLLARINVLETFTEHLQERWQCPPTTQELEQAAWVVSWNIWQMNGFTCAPPTNKEGVEVQSMLEGFEEPHLQPIQESLLSLLEADSETSALPAADTMPLCVIYNWRESHPFEFAGLKERGYFVNRKFYCAIGNPPLSQVVALCKTRRMVPSILSTQMCA